MRTQIEHPHAAMSPRAAFLTSVIVNLVSWPLLPRVFYDAVGPVVFAAVPLVSIATGATLLMKHTDRRVGLAVVAGAIVGTAAAVAGLFLMFLFDLLGE